MSDDPDTIVEHRPEACVCCGGNLHAALAAEVVSTCEQIELPAVAPIVTQHRRLAVRCPSCGTRGRRTRAFGRAEHALRAAAARGGDVPEDLSGALLRALQVVGLRSGEAAVMIQTSTLLTIVLMALVTYLTRILGYVALRDHTLSARTAVVLDAAPGCVLVAVIAPVFVANRPADLIALAVTLTAATRLPLLPTVLICVTAAGLLRHLLG
jgi:uncharacterized membrane protein